MANTDLIDTLPDIFNDTGTQITNGDDLNNYTTPGKYYCSSGSNASTLVNCPYSDTGFSLYVLIHSSGDQQRFQIILTSAGSSKLMYMRMIGSTINSWYRVDATVVN